MKHLPNVRYVTTFAMLQSATGFPHLVIFHQRKSKFGAVPYTLVEPIKILIQEFDLRTSRNLHHNLLSFIYDFYFQIKGSLTFMGFH
ncbi:hypothetical protein AVEN_123296-1 [Araneus ventricosus]|uniref:Uncharacterized protein n=1 Tax=Araneus ventricosus TaxID=182803 RepID=A0A4Y2NJU6_ARAVE|nr:hypothetical protein AVEN_123296-1 [Araneus ventricosus]